MARPGPQTFAKRQREQAKREKRKAKQEKMALRRAQKKDGEGLVSETEEEFTLLDGPVLHNTEIDER